MGALWCILLSFFTLKAFYKSEKRKARDRRSRNLPATNLDKIKAIGKTEEETPSVLSELDKKAKEDKLFEELRKQGYSDDIITMIIPTINNGQ